MKVSEVIEQPADWNTKSEKDQIAMIRKSKLGDDGIRKIVNPSEAVQLASVNHNGFSIKYIKTPSETVQLAAIECGWNAIMYIKNPCESAQLLSIITVPAAIQYIKKPTPKVIITILKTQVFINDKGKYNKFVKEHFDNNTILMKKWLRYGEAMREKNESI